MYTTMVKSTKKKLKPNWLARWAYRNLLKSQSQAIASFQERAAKIEQMEYIYDFEEENGNYQ